MSNTAFMPWPDTSPESKLREAQDALKELARNVKMQKPASGILAEIAECLHNHD